MTGKDGADYFVYKQKNNFGKKKPTRCRISRLMTKS